MAEAVDELVSEKLEEEKAAEPVVVKEEPTGDTDGGGAEKNNFDPTQILDEISTLKDTIAGFLNSGIGQEVKDEEEEELGTEALDELEEELETNDEDESEEIESVEADPAEINETEEAEEMKTTDSIKELASVLKQVVAGISDPKVRKKTSDALAGVLRKHAVAAKAKDSGIYAEMASRAKDAKSTVEDKDIGMEIAKKYNPHYKEK